MFKRPEESFFSADQVADLLMVSPSTVKYWRHRRKGPPFIRVPGSQQILYPRDGLEDWLAAGHSEPEVAKPRRGRPKKSVCAVPSRPDAQLEPGATSK